MGKLPLGLLQQFVLVARLGNLSRAAAQANLTVSALSHQMRQLEERLERRLFERGPRGVKLTAEGCVLLEAVGMHFDGIEHALAGYRTRHHDALTLSASPGIMSSWLVPRLPRLVAAHPELELSLQSGSTLVDFEREPVDVALRYGRGEWAGLHSERLFGEWIAPVAAPALIARMDGADPRELSRWPLLGEPNPSRRWSDWFGRSGGTPPTRYVAQFDSLDALRHAALEGLGVALGRMVTSKSLIDAGRLEVLGDNYLAVEEAYWLVYPPRSLEHRGLQLFRDWLLAEADDYRRQMSAFRPDDKPVG
ncbi:MULTISPECIES: LysR substrate-binding domain-containing protein [Rhodanobacter]|uniref:Transcriptional regulator n=1 Tax=Rhodanobacter denitrificans TaxID=666685 RepID=M4NMB2_9GAMM|nr:MULTISPECIES: LysR substrate-binding domain-containing protein [Rhodanobacter]AGG90793.1 transcriptional regulator [Rhodanobacter denitrificans]KZC21053.1 biotin transporter BioY [Rhodanobacter denitrificans]UJJ50871.1 LysR substrate-binding domain-containing protein [Rhodanobacter denitrificans]UJM86166.1 LysR substrate-binding domain-containing protein [Rhodanobacter denitrificans]UJM93586.1 LysR substrate-binding domain-containing protein [Rhodanobacter denitrificans]